MQAAFPMVPLSVRAWIITTVSFSETCNSLEASLRDAESRNVCIEDYSRDLNGWILLADFRTIFSGFRIGSQNGKKMRLFTFVIDLCSGSRSNYSSPPERTTRCGSVPPSFRHYREPLTTAMLVFQSAVTVRPPLSRRQLLIVRGDLAGYIQSFVPLRAPPSRRLGLCPPTTTCIVCLAGHALTSATYSFERTTRARESISIRRQRCHRICRIAETFAANRGVSRMRNYPEM